MMQASPKVEHRYDKKPQHYDPEDAETRYNGYDRGNEKTNFEHDRGTKFGKISYDINCKDEDDPCKDSEDKERANKNKGKKRPTSPCPNNRKTTKYTSNTERCPTSKSTDFENPKKGGFLDEDLKNSKCGEVYPKRKKKPKKPKLPCDDQTDQEDIYLHERSDHRFKDHDMDYALQAGANMADINVRRMKHTPQKGQTFCDMFNRDFVKIANPKSNIDQSAIKNNKMSKDYHDYELDKVAMAEPNYEQARNHDLTNWHDLEPPANYRQGLQQQAFEYGNLNPTNYAQQNMPIKHYEKNLSYESYQKPHLAYEQQEAQQAVKRRSQSSRNKEFIWDYEDARLKRNPKTDEEATANRANDYDSFIENIAREPPRYMIKTAEGYINSENEAGKLRLRRNKCQSEMMAFKQHSAPESEPEYTDYRRRKRDEKKSDDAPENNDDSYIKKLMDSFPRDQGSQDDLNLALLREAERDHLRVKRSL